VSVPVEFQDNGWDVRARLVDGTWVERAPRRRSVAPNLLREVVLLRWLAPQLPRPVPQPEVVSQDPLRVRHRLVPGVPCPGRTAAHGAQLGSFLAALHAVPVREALEHGALSAAETARQRQDDRNDFAGRVVPLLPVEARPDALRLLVRLAQADYAVALVHGDVGPAHVRVVDDEITGVIDWTDACLGDPALDLAWALNGTSDEFASGLRSTYPVSREINARARDWHLLGPWYEVRFGLDGDRPEFVRSGLEGATARLRHGR
jgi:aminoglycoside phosphotransferase (APT) family kinase protein